MPYPRLDDPQLCSSSGSLNHQPVDLVFFIAERVRCKECGRILGVTATKKLYLHLRKSRRTRRSDETRERLERQS